MIVHCSVLKFYFDVYAGIKIREHGDSTKQFPCFAIQPTYPYKKKGFYWTLVDYVENTFGLEDIFTSQSTTVLKNSSLFKVKEIQTLPNGRVFIICPVTLYKVLDRLHLYIVKNREFLLSIFHPGEEFWFQFPRFLMRDSLTLIDTQKMASVDVALAEQKIRYLTKNYSSCKEYSMDDYGGGGIVACVRDTLRAYLSARLECILPGIEETVGLQSGEYI